MNVYLEKLAMLHVRHRYVDDSARIHKMSNPVGSIKYDGANFFLAYDQSGTPSFTSRRPSVSGAPIVRTAQVPQLAKIIPELAGNVYNVELIHTGHSVNNVEDPARVSGLLNALPPRSLKEQAEDGPIRAAIFDKIDSSITTYAEKLVHMKALEKAFGDPSLMFVPEQHVGLPAIQNLVLSTLAKQQEGVIVLDHSAEEAKNPRVKIKHKLHFNLRVTQIHQELDKNGVPKLSAGALSIADADGKDVGKVGTGFDRKTREDIYANPHLWLGKLIKVKAMKPTASKLRSPVYVGDADGEIDKV